MKKLIVGCLVAALAIGAYAGPRGHGGPHHGGRAAFRPVHHHHYSYWGRGGRGFWPGFIGGMVGGAVINTIVETTPTVVTAPVVVSTPVVSAPVVVAPTVVSTPQVQTVWVEGRYVDQVQPDGSVVRVWNPGHYEQRTL